MKFQRYHVNYLDRGQARSPYPFMSADHAVTWVQQNTALGAGVILGETSTRELLPVAVIREDGTIVTLAWPDSQLADLPVMTGETGREAHYHVLDSRSAPQVLMSATDGASVRYLLTQAERDRERRAAIRQAQHDTYTANLQHVAAETQAWIRRNS
jgi:hypothetical protein